MRDKKIDQKKEKGRGRGGDRYRKVEDFIPIHSEKYDTDLQTKMTIYRHSFDT